MTLDQATETAAREARLFGLPMAVYRLPSWPSDVYGVRSAGKLPLEARRIETFEPPPSALSPQPPAPPTAAADPQGSLF